MRSTSRLRKSERAKRRRRFPALSNELLQTKGKTKIARTILSFLCCALAHSVLRFNNKP